MYKNINLLKSNGWRELPGRACKDYRVFEHAQIAGYVFLLRDGSLRHGFSLEKSLRFRFISREPVLRTYSFSSSVNYRTYVILPFVAAVVAALALVFPIHYQLLKIVSALQF